jgi:hypothetical protein
MNYDQLIAQAIDKAYQDQIKVIFDNFSNDMALAKSEVDAVNNSKERYKASMHRAFELRNEAIKLVGANEKQQEHLVIKELNARQFLEELQRQLEEELVSDPQGRPQDHFEKIAWKMNQSVKMFLSSTATE